MYNFDGLMVKNLDGEEVTGHGLVPKEGEKAFPLSAVITTALLNAYQDEPNLDPIEKLNRAKLAERVHGGGDLKLTVEECATIKKLVAKSSPALVMKQVWDVIEKEAEAE